MEMHLQVLSEVLFYLKNTYFIFFILLMICIHLQTNTSLTGSVSSLQNENTELKNAQTAITNELQMSLEHKREFEVVIHSSGGVDNFIKMCY